MECYPVCVQCTGLCRAPLPQSRAQRGVPARRRPWQPSDAPDVRLKCGCTCWAWPELHVLGDMVSKVLCEQHGWQAIAAERKPRKARVKPQIPGQEELVPF